jgi:hypothetical protein
MISFSRTATATLLVLTGLTACSASSPVAQGTSVPVTPSASVPAAAPSPSGPFNSVPAGPAPSKPAGIPKTPTDIVHSPGWVEGTITRGGSGPCYGLVTFDGVAYAMYSGKGTELAVGDHIKAALTPAKLRIDCGEGIPVTMGALQRFP